MTRARDENQRRLSKVAARLGRSGTRWSSGGYLYSPDLEDVLFVIDGRPGIVEEIEAAKKNVRSFLAGSFSALLADERFTEALPGYLPPDHASQERLPILVSTLERIAAMNLKL